MLPKVKAGQDVIMSDADALWLRDPTDYFSLPGVIESNIVASRGSFPRIKDKRWGATMCMGFILFRSQARYPMSKFLTLMEERNDISGDDQKSINYAALELGIVWDNEGSDTRYRESTEIGVGTIDTLVDDRGRRFRVTLLPHSMFPRDCGASPFSNQTIVAHCYVAAKKGASKTKWMKDANLWYLEEEEP